MTEFLSIARVLKKLPGDIPPVARTLFIAAVEAKIRTLAYNAAIELRREEGLSPRPLDSLHEPRERAASVYQAAIAILNLEFVELAAPERPVSSWKDLINEAAKVLDFDRLLVDATLGMSPVDE